MELLRRRAYARAGLMGNPSDGYHGKTLSVTVGNFYAETVLYEWEDVEIVLAAEDRVRFGSLGELARDVDLHGYYGGIRLVKATIKTFYEFCRERYPLHDRNFSIRYETNIPRAVGLAGSSAIIVATMRALVDFFDVPDCPACASLAGLECRDGAVGYCGRPAGPCDPGLWRTGVYGFRSRQDVDPGRLDVWRL